MHHLELGLFNYQLKSAKNELENIKQFTVDEFQNMIKVFIFVIEEIIIKYHKETMNANQANKLMNHWLTCFITGIRCLCNGTRLICHGLQRKVIDAEIVKYSHISKHVFIPHITLTTSETKLPFVLGHQQLPVHVAFAMAINKSQGKTSGRVGVYLPEHVF
ncbi:ATP-dependent DNA helicase PIF1-like [Rhizophagus irregularis DAOM 181602=DAOM 197198]|nr:ATP-dependent DNA helicase PIF1-like [Rhizophagus irregularis DAOM 181602=DAOM 197198]